MLALLVAVALFAYYLVLGLGVTALLPRSIPVLTRLQLAPAVGSSLFVVPAIMLSRLGLPVGTFAVPLGIALLIAGVGGTWLRRPRVTRADVLAFAVPVAIGLVMAGAPLLSFGFHWLSYSNDDMGNYSLGAQRFIESGYFTDPPPATWLDNRDLAQVYWNMAAISGERSGAEVMLAAASSIFGHNPFETFMPFIVSCFLAIVAASGTLGWPRPGRLLPALISTGVAVFALSLFGVFYQLLGQELGLQDAVALTGIAVGPLMFNRRRGETVRLGVVAGVLGAGLMCVYPEIMPFVLLGAGIALAVRFRDVAWKSFGIGAVVSLGAAVILLNAHLDTMVRLIVSRLLTATLAVAPIPTTIFPYYLIPSGFPNLWGLQPIASFFDDPLQSALIVIAIALTCVATVATIVLLVRTRTPAAPVLVGMMVFAVIAARHREPFALYKLAMYSQPFLIASLLSGLAMLAARLPRIQTRRWVLATPALLLVACTIPAGAAYRQVSADGTARAAFAEIPVASSDALLVQVGELAAGAHHSEVIADTPISSLAKVEAGYFRDDDLFFPARDYFAGAINTPRTSPFRGVRYTTRLDLTRLVGKARRAQFVTENFDYEPPTRRPATMAAFPIDRRVRDFANTGMPAFVLAATARQTIINRRVATPPRADLVLLPRDRAGDRLNFVASTMGGTASDRSLQPVSLFQLEGDYYFPGQSVSAGGRYLLFALNGRPRSVRLSLDISTTLKSDERFVPRAIAVGTRRVSFHAVGRGSARLLSDPIEPQVLGGNAYVGIDMGTFGSYFPNKRRGLMRMFGSDVLTDGRLVVGFVRDVSLVPTGAPLSRMPQSIADFPRDLANPDLFYSGIYEDGWMSEDASAELTSAGTSGRLALDMIVPKVADDAFSASMTVSVDGAPIGTWPAPLGRSTVDVPFYGALGAHTILVHFSRSQRMPGADTRIVSARIAFLGFR